MGWLKAFWIGVKDWSYKYIGGLVMDEKDGKLAVSLGRVALVAMLAMFFWTWRRDVLDGDSDVKVPDGMLDVFYVLVGYVFGGKVVGGLKMKWGYGQQTEITSSSVDSPTTPSATPEITSPVIPPVQS